MVEELIPDTGELRLMVDDLVFEYEDSDFSFDEDALFNDLAAAPTRSIVSLGFEPELKQTD